MKYFQTLYLDLEKDVVCDLYKQDKKLIYKITTPHHSSANLLRNLSKVCGIPLLKDENDRYYIQDEIESYIDQSNSVKYILKFKDTLVAIIYPNKKIEKKATLLAVSKVLMSQTKNYKLPLSKTLVEINIKQDYKFKTDVHTHMNANLYPDDLIALALVYNIDYPLYYVKKLKLELSQKQSQQIKSKRQETINQFKNIKLEGKYYDRKIDDNTFINFRDLILNNNFQRSNLTKIKNSLTMLKDGQAVFTNLEKLYLYRYVFCKAKFSLENIKLDTSNILDLNLLKLVKDIKHIKDKYKFTLYQTKLYLIAKFYKTKLIKYVEISDTSFTKQSLATTYLKQAHLALPIIYKKTGVLIRFLCAIRRVPLTLVEDFIARNDYIKESVATVKALSFDPYIAGVDIVGEEINDINELKFVFEQLAPIAKVNKQFVYRVHAGENDNLKNNVLKSIELVLNNIDDKTISPYIRIGHGLYTPKLTSKDGKKLVEIIKNNNVYLEFQLSSNVRLNNLNDFKSHPLKKYLDYDLNCIQGSDGCALYGTDPMEEEISLITLLELNDCQIRKMTLHDQCIYLRAIKDFKQKSKYISNIDNIFDRYTSNIQTNLVELDYEIKDESKLLSTNKFFKDKYKPFDSNKIAIIIVGGSFNSEKRVTKMNDKEIKMLESLLKLDPNKYYFVVGYKLNAYENYIHNLLKDKFEFFTIAPTKMYKAQIKKILASNIYVHMSIESNQQGLYKSYNYEIFEQRKSILLALDGNASCLNIIQEAKNGKAKSKIIISSYSTYLKRKGTSLYGYVNFVDYKDDLFEIIKGFK